jgi:NTP pyrophosphatase (non-canonical NTP hydrolase)
MSVEHTFEGGYLTADEWAFLKFYAAFQKSAHAVGVSKGFNDPGQNDGELISLIHSELGEVTEAFRNDNPKSEKIPAYSSVEEELADTVLRIMAMSQTRGYRLAEAIIAKNRYNATRPHKHGGKKF